jgi:hypothetical protein
VRRSPAPANATTAIYATTPTFFFSDVTKTRVLRPSFHRFGYLLNKTCCVFVTASACVILRFPLFLVFQILWNQARRQMRKKTPGGNFSFSFHDEKHGVKKVSEPENARKKRKKTTMQPFAFRFFSFFFSQDENNSWSQQHSCTKCECDFFAPCLAFHVQHLRSANQNKTRKLCVSALILLDTRHGDSGNHD